MSNETKKTALPKLRFPEFRNAQEWEIKELGKVSDVRDGTHDSPKFYSTGKPLVTSKNLLSNGDLDLENTSLISEDDYEQINKRSRVDVGDILFGMIGTIGNPVKVKSNEFAIKNVALIKQQKNLLNEYLVYFLNSKYFASELNRLNTGNTQKFIALGILRGIEIFCPSLPEQQKIAATLSSLDDLLTAQSAQLAALQAHKRGLMQALFPAEGETVPKLRFPEFQGVGEWEEKKLGEICKMQAGKFVAASNIHENNEDGFFPCYGGNGLRGYTKTLTHEGKYSLIGRQGALCGNVMLANGKFHATEHAVVTTPRDAVDTDWLYYLLVILDLNQYSTGAAQPGLSVQNIEKVEIKIPSTEAEQQKIADCLTSLDNRISAQTEKIEALKLHKKGLMQHLFPAAAEPAA